MATFNDLARNIRRGIGQSTSKKNMLFFGETAIEIIVTRTRSGKGVKKTGAAQNKLKRLSAPYIAYRRTKKLDATTSPGKSNLTFSGQLLRSMRVKEATNRRVRWGPNRKLRGGTGAFRSGGLTNEQLGEIVSRERPFNFLSKREITKLAKVLDKVLTKDLEKI
jgi:hypothetical protein